jgi:uncharacterized membrane protein YdbT with pleckstrin-like domain
MIDLSKFAHTAPDEETIYFLRPHWLVMMPLVLGFAILLALPFVAWFGIQWFHVELFGVPGYEPLFVMCASIFFLFSWLFLFQTFIDYFLDIWVVTTHRIIDITQTGMFGRTTSELTLDRVQDVSSQVNGFIRTIFDFGTIYIQTAGEHERFVFENIPHPVHVSKRILELAEHRKIAVEQLANSAPASNLHVSQ